MRIITEKHPTYQKIQRLIGFMESLDIQIGFSNDQLFIYENGRLKYEFIDLEGGTLTDFPPVFEFEISILD